MVTTQQLNPLVSAVVSCQIRPDTRLLGRIAFNRNDFRVMYDYSVRNGNGTGKRDERIRALHERGWSLRMIGRKVGLSHGHVRRILAATVPPAEQLLHPLPVPLDDESEAEGPWSHWSVADQARAYRAKLRDCDDPAMRELIAYRLRHVMPADEYAKLCARQGRSGTFGGIGVG